MTDRGRDFANIAYTILVVEKKPALEAAAAAMGMGYAALHSRLVGRTCFSAEEIRGLIRAVPDPRLVSYLLDGTRFVAAERAVLDEEARHQNTGLYAIQRGATRVVVEATDILEIVDAALAGGGLDHQKDALVLSEIDDTERALASLRLQINGGSR